MISFNYECEFHLENETNTRRWIESAIEEEGKEAGDICYIFCDDEYLYDLNKQFLDHDTYTDIITFDYVMGNEINGDIFISVDRVKENSISFSVPFSEELGRVIIHGILHLCGYEDKSPKDQTQMRSKENFYLAQRPCE